MWVTSRQTFSPKPSARPTVYFPPVPVSQMFSFQHLSASWSFAAEIGSPARYTAASTGLGTFCVVPNAFSSNAVLGVVVLGARLSLSWRRSLSRPQP